MKDNAQIFADFKRRYMQELGLNVLKVLEVVRSVPDWNKTRLGPVFKQVVHRYARRANAS